MDFTHHGLDKSGTARLALIRTLAFLADVGFKFRITDDFASDVRKLSTDFTAAAAALSIIKYYNLVLMSIAREYSTTARTTTFRATWRSFMGILLFITLDMQSILKTEPTVSHLPEFIHIQR